MSTRSSRSSKILILLGLCWLQCIVATMFYIGKWKSLPRKSKLKAASYACLHITFSIQVCSSKQPVPFKKDRQCKGSVIEKTVNNTSVDSYQLFRVKCKHVFFFEFPKIGKIWVTKRWLFTCKYLVLVPWKENLKKPSTFDKYLNFFNQRIFSNNHDR